MIKFSCEALGAPVIPEEYKKAIEEEKSLKKLWIGVDMDGTLATYDAWKGWDHFGEPVKAVVDKIHEWNRQGIQVCIFTARMSKVSLERNNLTRAQMESVVQQWCKKHIGYVLPCKTEKDCYMLAFLDDSAVQISKNKGTSLAENGFDIIDKPLEEIGYDKFLKARRCYSLSYTDENGVEHRLRSPMNTIQWWLDAWKETPNMKEAKFDVHHRYLGRIGTISNAFFREDTGVWEYDWIDGGPVL